MAEKDKDKQALMTKFFRPTDPTKPYWMTLFEKEEAERKARGEESPEEEVNGEEDRAQRMASFKKRTEGCEIVPGVFLGSRFAASNLDWLKSANVKAVVNVTPDGAIPNFFPELVTYHRVPIADDGAEKLAPHFDAAFAFIELYTAKNEAVLVHCAEGRSRSPSIIMAYLILKRSLPHSEAEALIASKSATSLLINDGFRKQLAQLCGGAAPSAEKKLTQKADEVVVDANDNEEAIVVSGRKRLKKKPKEADADDDLLLADDPTPVKKGKSIEAPRPDKKKEKEEKEKEKEKEHTKNKLEEERQQMEEAAEKKAKEKKEKEAKEKEAETDKEKKEETKDNETKDKTKGKTKKKKAKDESEKEKGDTIKKKQSKGEGEEKKAKRERGDEGEEKKEGKTKKRNRDSAGSKKEKKEEGDGGKKKSKKAKEGDAAKKTPEKKKEVPSVVEIESDSVQSKKQRTELAKEKDEKEETKEGEKDKEKNKEKEKEKKKAPGSATLSKAEKANAKEPLKNAPTLDRWFKAKPQ